MNSIQTALSSARFNRIMLAGIDSLIGPKMQRQFALIFIGLAYQQQTVVMENAP